MSATTTNFEPINPELPEHIIFEILTRLPVKSLRRFQCVSKLWNSMISDPDHFARTHYARSAFRPKLLISFSWPGNQLLFSADYQKSMVGTSQDHHLLNLSSEFGHFLNGMLYSTRYYHTKIHSPAALCCAGTDQTRDNSMLCNCMTYFVLNLDEATCKVDHWDDDDDAFYSEHTIVRRLRFGARPLGDYTDSISIGRIIYSLRDPENIIWDGDWWCGSLIVLDTETEVFYSVPVPSHKNDHRTLVFELRGRFAMANDMDVWSGRGNSIVLWVLEDYEKEIWSCKTCVLDVSGSGLKLFGVTPEDELLVATENLTEGPFCLFFYDLKNETTRRVEVLGLYERFRDELKWFRSYFAPFKTNLDFYVESLQPPKDFRSDVPKSLLCGVEFKELSITE